MSRSRRKHPWVTDQQNGQTRYAKRRASRKVRQSEDEEISDGKWYRKVENPWHIRDWCFYDPIKGKRK